MEVNRPVCFVIALQLFCQAAHIDSFAVARKARRKGKPNDYFFDIDHVGVSNVSHPILIASSLKPFTQTTIGAFSFTTSLARDRKGINMSRLTEQLQRYHEAS